MERKKWRLMMRLLSKVTNNRLSDHAQDCIVRFIDAVDEDRQPDRDSLDFVTDALRKILVGENAKEAFEIRSTRGRVRNASSISPQLLTALKVECMYRMQGGSYVKACEMVADHGEKHGETVRVNFETVKRHHDDFKDLARHIFDDVIADQKSEEGKK